MRSLENAIESRLSYGKEWIVHVAGARSGARHGDRFDVVGGVGNRYDRTMQGFGHRIRAVWEHGSATDGAPIVLVTGEGAVVGVLEVRSLDAPDPAIGTACNRRDSRHIERPLEFSAVFAAVATQKSGQTNPNRISHPYWRGILPFENVDALGLYAIVIRPSPVTHLDDPSNITRHPQPCFRSPCDSLDH